MDKLPAFIWHGWASAVYKLDLTTETWPDKPHLFWTEGEKVHTVPEPSPVRKSIELFTYS